MAVDREGWIRWEDTKEVARIHVEEEATRKAEEEEEAMLAIERAAVEA